MDNINGIPFFTIIATDATAPVIILKWIEQVSTNKKAGPEQWLKCKDAFDVYLDVCKWQQENPEKVKLPDKTTNQSGVIRESKINQIHLSKEDFKEPEF